jgi:hypothetical protein
MNKNSTFKTSRFAKPMNKFFILLFFNLWSISSFSQLYWRVENERGEELLLTIRINGANQTFETYTRKEALREMAGSMMYMLAKTAGKIKYPELMHGEGKISFQSDTTFYTGNVDYPDKIFTLKAKSWKDNFYGLLTDSKNKTTILTGKKLESDKPIRDYPALISSSYSLVEQFYWDSNLKKAVDWQNFKKDLNELKSKIADDYELSMSMMWLGKKLNQVPHEIKKKRKNSGGTQQSKSNKVHYINEKKGLLNLFNLPETPEEIHQIFKEIADKNLDVLILEASGNRNLSLSSAMSIANHLSTKPGNWGSFLTRKWAETGESIPLPASYEQILKNPLDLSGFTTNILTGKGFYLKTVPSTTVFKGKIYMVINKWSSNVAESLAIYLKNEKLATLVGQKSAGSPVLNHVFDLDKLYFITIPYAQFYDKNGKCYQGIGIEPDLPVEQNALAYVLKL